MNRRVVYLSGPIAGYPEGNEKAFRAVATYLEAQGYEAIVPHDLLPAVHEGECPKGYRSEGARHAAACHLRSDLVEMLRHADEIWMLPGWESSVGARLEMQVAAACGLPVLFLAHEMATAWRRVEPEITRAAKALRDMGLVIAEPELDSEDPCGHEARDRSGHCFETECINYAGGYR